MAPIRKARSDAPCTEREPDRRPGGIRAFGRAAVLTASIIVGGLVGCGKDGNLPKDPQPGFTANRPPITAVVPEQAKKIVVLTREMFKGSLQRYVDAKAEEGFEVEVVTVEEIPSGSGDDPPGRIRDYLAQLRVSGGMDYLFIIGDVDADDYRQGEWPNYETDKPWEVHARYVSMEGADYSEGPMEDFGTLEESYNDSIMPADEYYANFSGTWDTDGDGIYGEMGLMEDEFSLDGETAVGRLPVQTVEELEAMLDTIMGWAPQERPVHLVTKGGYCQDGFSTEERENIEESIVRGNLPEVKDVAPHACATDEGGDIASLINEEGADFVSSFSHGWTYGILEMGPYGYYLNYSSTAVEKPPAYFAYACLVGAIDHGSDVLAEWLLKTGRVVAFIGASRSHAPVHFDPWNHGYLRGDYRLGDMLSQYKRMLATTESMTPERKEQLMQFQLFGDPAMLIAEMPEVSVTTPEFVDVSVTADANAVLYNNSDFSVTTLAIYNVSNNDVEVFNGTVAPILPKPFSFAHHLDSSLERYVGAKLIVENGAGGAVAVSGTTFYSGNIVKGPHEMKGVVAGAETTVPVIVIGGDDGPVVIKADYYPGCYEDGCDLGVREKFEVYSGEHDLAAGRKVPAVFVMPGNANPFEAGRGYGLPLLEFYIEGSSRDGFTYLMYLEE